MSALPNAISVLRAVAALAVVVLLMTGASSLALLTFTLAAATDAVDGWLARRLRATSVVGAFLDPLADKVLVLGALAGLVGVGGVDPFAVALILSRELVVTVMRAAALARGVVVASNRYGKAKAVLQGLAVGTQIAAIAWPTVGIGPTADAILWIAALTTVATGVDVGRRAAAGIAAPPSSVGAHAR